MTLHICVLAGFFFFSLNFERKSVKLHLEPRQLHHCCVKEHLQKEKRKK